MPKDDKNREIAGHQESHRVVKDAKAQKLAEKIAAKPKKAKKAKGFKKPNKVDGYMEKRAERQVNKAAKWSLLCTKLHLGAPLRIPLGQTDDDLDEFVSDGNATIEIVGDKKLYRLDSELEDQQQEEA